MDLCDIRVYLGVLFADAYAHARALTPTPTHDTLHTRYLSFVTLLHWVFFRAYARSKSERGVARYHDGKPDTDRGCWRWWFIRGGKPDVHISASRGSYHAGDVGLSAFHRQTTSEVFTFSLRFLFPLYYYFPLSFRLCIILVQALPFFTLSIAPAQHLTMVQGAEPHGDAYTCSWGKRRELDIQWGKREMGDGRWVAYWLVYDGTGVMGHAYRFPYSRLLNHMLHVPVDVVEGVEVISASLGLWAS